jgi:hypothetical protein
MQEHPLPAELTEDKMGTIVGKMATPQPSPLAECQITYCHNRVAPEMATCSESHEWTSKGRAGGTERGLVSVPTADRELTDADILDRFGDLIAEADRAFREDPEFAVKMAQDAGDLFRKRAGGAASRVKDTARRDAEALALAHEGYSRREIAERLGVAHSSVAALLVRARRARAGEAGPTDTHP